MPTFSFSAKDRDGTTVAGTLVAESEKAVAGLLRDRGLLPQRIRALSETTPLGLDGVLERAFLGAPLATQMFVFQQLHTMVSAGMSLSEALGSLISRGGVGRLRRPMVEAHRQVASGGRLSDAFGRFPWLFSGLQLSMIEAGETSGGLDSAFGRITAYLEKDLQIRRNFSRATLYPKLLLLAAVLISRLPLLVLQGFNQYARATAQIIVPALGILAGLWVFFRLALQVPSVALAWDAAKLSLPGIGGMVRKLALAKFCRAMAALYASGIPVASSVELAAGASGNKFIQSRLLKAAIPLRNGVDLHAALSETGALTGVVRDMLATGQVTGGVDTMMDKVAEYYEAEAGSSMDKTAIVVGVLVFLAVAAFVGYTIISMYGVYGQNYTDILND